MNDVQRLLSCVGLDRWASEKGLRGIRVAADALGRTGHSVARCVDAMIGAPEDGLQIDRDRGPRRRDASIRPDMLHVVAVVSNPERWRSRISLFERFRLHMEQSGVHLIVVEHAFGDRPFAVTRAENPDHVQVRGGRSQEIWLKEALINLGIRQNLTRRFPDWKYVAFVDADIEFLRKDWATEAVHELMHSPVCQLWSHSVDLGPDGEVITNDGGIVVDRSFAAAWAAGEAHVPGDFNYYSSRDRRQHYGYAWAMRRDGYDGIGGLLDWVIMGSADYHMAFSFVGMRVHDDHQLSPGYHRRLAEFHARCERFIKRDLGVVKGTVAHGWHGSKRKRGYVSRRDVIIESGFDPDVDLSCDAQGLPFLATDNYKLRDGLRRYFQSRNEDSIDT
jgi:hypothetical protein